MDVIYSLIPGMMLFGLVFVVVLFWAIKRGQYDDLEGDGNRILMDEEKDTGDAASSNNEESDESEAQPPSKPKGYWPDAD